MADEEVATAEETQKEELTEEEEQLAKLKKRLVSRRLSRSVVLLTGLRRHATLETHYTN